MTTYGVQAPRITDVAVGMKLRDFPATLCAQDNRAEFTIAGGRDVVSVIVTGLADYRRPRIKRRCEQGWQDISHARVSDLDGVQTFVAEDGTFGAVFLVHSDAEEQTLRVTSGQDAGATQRIRVSACEAPSEGPTALHHAALVQAPWMDAPIHLRFPETLNTDTLDFIDHHRDDMAPRIDPAPLARIWNTSEGESLWFAWLYDNQAAGGRLSPNADCVDLEFWLENRRDKTVHLGLQFCPVLAGTCFDDPAYERTWGRFDGQWRRLCDMDRGDGNFALCHYGVQGGPEFAVPLPWGKSDDLLDIGMVAITSPDRRYVFAIAWPDCRRILTNGDIPCVHSDPPSYTAPPGKRLHIRGKLYLIEGTLNDLHHRYRRELLPLERSGS